MHAARSSVIHPGSSERPPPEAPTPALTGVLGGTLASLAGTRVLVVDDNDDSREIICTLLTTVGATVLGVESVAKAMDGVYNSFDPDVVLTDFSMPDADGVDLIREFRKVASTRVVAVPILVLSGHSESHWRERALDAGAEDVLSKPFEPALLISRIAAALASGGTSSLVARPAR
jgi:DNA-binding response OmpR family regulator